MGRAFFAAVGASLLFTLGIFRGHVQAGDDTWLAATDGYFHEGVNWTDGSAPGPNDTVGYNLPGAYTVWWAQGTGDRTTKSLSVEDGDVTFRVYPSIFSPYTWTISSEADIVGATLSLGETGYTGQLNVDIDYEVSVRHGGILNILAGSEVNVEQVYISDGGNGTLGITGGGQLNSTKAILTFYGGVGTATVDGAGSTWNNTGDLTVGRIGTGTLHIKNGGVVEVGSSTFLGSEYAEGLGSIVFDNGTLATGSLAAAPNTLGGTGTVNAHGLVMDLDLLFDQTHGVQQQLTLNSEPGQNVTINLDADGTGLLGAGFRGAGSLTVADGAVVASVSGYLGLRAGSMGTATVEGDGSTWNNTGLLHVGSEGDGSLLVTGGGRVDSTVGYVGYWLDTTGTVIVDGAAGGTSSTWHNTGDLYVGYLGTGTLHVSNGGVVEVGASTIVAESDESYGEGSVVFDNGTLATGALFAEPESLGGTGTVDAHGLVMDLDLVFDQTHGLQQQLTLDSQPGQNVTINLDVDGTGVLGAGYSGQGSLTIADGVVVASAGGYLGYGYSGSTGTATVQGAGSTWNNSGPLTVGNGGDGMLEITGGGLVSNTDGIVGGSSQVTVDGTAPDGTPSKWLNSGPLRVGENDCSVAITGGGLVTSTAGEIGLGMYDPGRITVDGKAANGARSTWDNAGSLEIAPGSTLTVTGGGLVNNTSATMDGNVTIDGTAEDGTPSTWNNSSWLEVSFGSTLTITGGGLVSNTESGVGLGSEGYADGHVMVFGAAADGTPSRWTNSRSVYVGGESQGSVLVGTGGEVSVGEHLVISANGTFNLAGGTLRFGEPNPIFGGGVLNYDSGTIAFDCDMIVGAGMSQVTDASLFGPNPDITVGKGLAVSGRATLITPITLNGGTLSVGSLVGASYVTFNTGTLELTASDLTVVSGGLFGDTLALSAGQHIMVTQQTTVAHEGLVTVNDNASLGAGVLRNQGEIELAGAGARLDGGTFTNEGLVRGEGRVNAALDNDGGEVRVGTGQRMVFTAAANANAGNIVVDQGQVEFLGQLNNLAGGDIHATGNVTLRFIAGLTNAGAVNFDGGESQVYGNLDIAAHATNPGRVSIGDAGRTVFFDDVIQNGLVVIGAGARATFYGDVTGSGEFLGEGTSEFLGTISPGTSPGAASFEGNVLLGGATIMELGGIQLGGFDQLLVGGQLELAGLLNVVLWDGFAPSAGQSFDLMDWGSLSGTFSAVDLPALAGGLAWDASQLYTTGELLVVAAPVALPGDYNDDGIVDAADYTVWRDHLGQFITLPNEDPEQTPGEATEEDYVVWKSHFGQLAGGTGTVGQASSGTQAAVPEPASGLLLVIGLGGVTMLVRRRR